MKLLKYLQYSGIFITIVLNPLHWRLGFASGRDEIMGPNSWFFKITLLAVGLNVVVDDGSW
jgi:hypothetical protein